MHDYLVRGDRPGDDPIFTVNAEATARKARGEPVVNATLGALFDDEGKFAILPTVSRAIREVPPEQWASYAPISGTGAFLDAVQDDLLGGHPKLRELSCAVATPGGTGALRNAISTFLERGQSLLTTSFYWSPYATIADEHERKVATFSMFTGGGAALDVAALDRALGELIAKQGRALLLLNDPCHNPTGYSLSEADWDAVVEVVARHAGRAPVTLLLDAAYSAYAPTGLTVPLARLEKLAGRALVLIAWSASKSFTQYGLRVGSLVAVGHDAKERARLAAALGYACRGTWSNCNHGGMEAITRCLADPTLRASVDAERAALVRLVEERVRLFNEAAQGKGLPYPRYDGGFFVTVFSDDAKGVAERMKADGVFVVPLAGALRIALCAVASSDVPRLVDSLAHAIR